jgi:hypothetical protein
MTVMTHFTVMTHHTVMAQPPAWPPLPGAAAAGGYLQQPVMCYATGATPHHEQHQLMPAHLAGAWNNHIDSTCPTHLNCWSASNTFG